MDQRDAASYLSKARESLAGAESELAAGRSNNAANRAYYACLQAAISALLLDGVQAPGDQWPHAFVQSQFVGRLINRRHRYPTALRNVLIDLQIVRHRADYRVDEVTETEARRALRRARDFLTAIHSTEG